MSEVTVTAAHPTQTIDTPAQPTQLKSWRVETQLKGASTWTSTPSIPIADGETTGTTKFQNVGVGAFLYRAYWVDVFDQESDPSEVVEEDIGPGKPLPGSISAVRTG